MPDYKTCDREAEWCCYRGENDKSEIEKLIA